jgi:2-dehydropantoate 2-reductase
VGQVARRYISIPYGLDWWPSQDESGSGDRAVDHLMGHRLAEHGMPEDSYEDFPPPPSATVVDDQNKPQEKNSTVGISSSNKTLSQVVKTSARKALSPSRRIPEASPRIYVLGAGNFGRFVAHNLAGLGDPPPVTLLSDRKDLVRQWDDEGRMLELIIGDSSCPRAGIDVSHISMLESQADSEKFIDKLIVTMKANATVPALLAIKKRLLPSSTICFLQNGMGIVEDVNTRVFPNPATRPRYIVGVTSHTTKDQRGRMFTTIQTKAGYTYLSLVPLTPSFASLKTFSGERVGDEKSLVQRMNYGWTASSRKLMISLKNCTLLNTKGFRYEEILLMQFKRLAVNAVLGPLSVVFDCPHGKLLENFAVRRLMQGLMDEIVAVAQNVPELREMDRFKDQFTSKKMMSLIIQIASRSNNTLGSMLEDVRRGRLTDIDFINGYVVKRGQELGVPCPVNRTVIQMVKAKQAMNRSEIASFIPFKDK